MKNLILLHGALGHTRNFEPYEAALSQHFQLHHFLFAGHGDSALPANGIRLSDYVAQVHEYCERHYLQEVHLFGYSMGGYVALCYALQQPHRVQSVLTLATKFSWTEEGAARESAMLNPGVIAEKVPKYAGQLAALHGAGKWEELLPAIAGMMMELGRHPLLSAAALSALAIPVQLMIGDSDSMVTAEETHAACKSIPGARMAVLPGTKHPIESVRPGLLLGLMRDFWLF